MKGEVTFEAETGDIFVVSDECIEVANMIKGSAALESSEPLVMNIFGPDLVARYSDPLSGTVPQANPLSAPLSELSRTKLSRTEDLEEGELELSPQEREEGELEFQGEELEFPKLKQKSGKRGGSRKAWGSDSFKESKTPSLLPAGRCYEG